MLELDFDAVIGTSHTQAATFGKTLASDVSASLGIAPDRVRVVELLPGSVRAVIAIDAASAVGHADAEACAHELAAQAADASSPLRQRVATIVSARVLPPESAAAWQREAESDGQLGGEGGSRDCEVQQEQEAEEEQQQEQEQEQRLAVQLPRPSLGEEDTLFYVKLAKASNDIDGGKLLPLPPPGDAPGTSTIPPFSPGP